MNRLQITTLLWFFVLSAAPGQNALYVPDTLGGSSINLNLQHGTRSFYGGFTTATMGANAAFLAPTLLLQHGQNITLNVHNSLNDTTTIHWHGLHVAPQNDGGPHTVILPNQTWSPSFTVRDRASTYWYHPHLHHKTAEHVAGGIAGFIIVRDSNEATLDLPRTYAWDDLPLVVQTRQFDAARQIVIGQHLDTAVMANGTLKAFRNVPAQRVRLRLLNGSLERVFRFGLNTSEVFHQIASDGGLLAAPVAMTRLQLAPGERAEIVVDFTGRQGQTVLLQSFGSELTNATYGASQPGMGMGQQLPGYSNNPLNGTNFTILELRAILDPSNPAGPLPNQLSVHTPWAEAQADQTRILTFMPANMGPTAIQGPFMINNAHFEMNVVNQYVPFENIEVWELRNQTPIGHPFHLHDVPFYVTSINGTPPPPHLAGRKDVIFVPAMGTVRFITQFESFFNDTLPYMYHCHMLTHEDDGMMGQFVVQSPLRVSEPSGIATGLRVWPNPVSDKLYVDFGSNVPHTANDELEILDAAGRVVLMGRLGEGGHVDVRLLPAGSYAVRRAGESKVVRWVKFP